MCCGVGNAGRACWQGSWSWQRRSSCWSFSQVVGHSRKLLVILMSHEVMLVLVTGDAIICQLPTTPSIPTTYSTYHHLDCVYSRLLWWFLKSVVTGQLHTVYTMGVAHYKQWLHSQCTSNGYQVMHSAQQPYFCWALSQKSERAYAFKERVDATCMRLLLNAQNPRVASKCTTMSCLNAPQCLV